MCKPELGGNGLQCEDYVGIAGALFFKRSADPSSSQIKKTKSAIGVKVRCTGRTWVGASGGIWAQLDESRGEKQGWILVSGPGFDLPGDTALLDASLEETEIRIRRILSSKKSGTAEEWPTRPLSDAQWRQKLSQKVYESLREKATEPEGTGEYWRFEAKRGHFKCAGCEEALYSAASKFDHKAKTCGWPAFSSCYQNDGKAQVVVQVDWVKTGREICCRGCGGHLGHVFMDADVMTNFTATERHCVNSVAIIYDEGSPSFAESSGSALEGNADHGPFTRQMRTHVMDGSYPTVSA